MLVKKELSSIPLLPVVESEDPTATYVVNAGVFDLPKSGRILAVDFRYADQPYALKCRFFSDGRKFLTVHQWPADCWHETTPIESGTSYFSHSGEAWSPDAANVAAAEFFGTHQGWRRYGAADNVAGYVEWFVDRYRTEKRERDEGSKMAKMDYHFSLFPDIPDDFADFLNERVWTTGYTFISKVQRGKVRNARCSRCGAEYQVPSTVRHKEMGSCPECGSATLYIGDWYGLHLVDETTVCFNHKVNGDLLTRWTKIVRTIAPPNYTPAFSLEDIGMNLHLHEGKKTKLYCYVKRPMHYMTGPFWTRRPMDEPVTIPAHVYTRNLTEVFGASHYRVNLADAMSGPSAMVDWNRILKALRTDPAAEYLLKLRLPTLVGWKIFDDLKEGEKPSFSRCLGVDGSMLPLYREFSVTPIEHRLLKAYGKPVSFRDFACFRTLRLSDSAAEECLKRMTFTRFVNYFSRQPLGKRPAASLIRLWLDYIDMCTGLGIDLSRKSTRFPKNIITAHDSIKPTFDAAKAEAEDALFRERMSPIYEALPMTRFERDGMIARFPQSRTELTTEGQSLHHCVWSDGYFKRHMTGERMIVFIRDAADPDRPWFTMELQIKNFVIVQLYGYSNRIAPSNVSAFAKRFVNTLKAAMTAGKEAAA